MVTNGKLTAKVRGDNFSGNNKAPAMGERVIFELRQPDNTPKQAGLKQETAPIPGIAIVGIECGRFMGWIRSFDAHIFREKLADGKKVTGTVIESVFFSWDGEDCYAGRLRFFEETDGDMEKSRNNKPIPEGEVAFT